MNGELWADIEAYDNYTVSNFGNVKNVKTGIIRKATVNRSGYLEVNLNENNSKKTFAIHKLVAGAFYLNLIMMNKI